MGWLAVTVPQYTCDATSPGASASLPFHLFSLCCIIAILPSRRACFSSCTVHVSFSLTSLSPVVGKWGFILTTLQLNISLSSSFPPRSPRPLSMSLLLSYVSIEPWLRSCCDLTMSWLRLPCDLTERAVSWRWSCQMHFSSPLPVNHMTSGSNHVTGGSNHVTSRNAAWYSGDWCDRFMTWWGQMTWADGMSR